MAYEVDSEKNVRRMIEVFRDGRMEVKSAAGEGRSTVIHTAFDIGGVDQESREFFPFETTRSDFERYWKATRA